MIYFDHGVQKWRKRKRSKLSEKKMNMAISSHIPLGPRRMLQCISKISGKFRFIFESIRPAINIRGDPTSSPTIIQSGIRAWIEHFDHASSAPIRRYASIACLILGPSSIADLLGWTMPLLSNSLSAIFMSWREPMYSRSICTAACAPSHHPFANPA
jgi:hypothetical protein